MLSDRVQRQIDRLLDQAEEAIALRQWEDLRATCETLLSLAPDNSDAARYLILANDSLATEVVSDSSDVAEPAQDWVTQLDNSEGLDFFFRQINGTNGRINRSSYVLRAVPVFVATAIAIGLFANLPPLGVVEGSGSWNLPAQFGGLVGIFFVIASLVMIFCSTVRRFHDFNWGGARILLLLVPIVNIAIVFMLLFRSGTQGTNDYGNEPVDLAVGF
jgi:uncharacterized membrane protein YhaH (DUF805 family)